MRLPVLVAKPRALILTLDPDVSEMEELVYSLGYETAGVLHQNRDRPDPQWFLGHGKLAQARDAARELDVSLVIVNGDLKPNQIYNVTDFLNAEPGGPDDPRGLAIARRSGARQEGDGDGAVSAAGGAGATAAARGGATTRAGATAAARGGATTRAGATAAADAGLDHSLVLAGDRDFRAGAGERSARDSDADAADRSARDSDADAADRSARDSDADAAERRATSRSGERTRARRARARDGDRRQVDVYDRLRVILEIFTERARSQEARLQVDLAKLRYEMPIVKEYIHLAKKGEHPGFLGGGEYEVNYYYDMMNKRIAKIRRDLERVSEERNVRRKHRRKRGFHLVSLAGYTNAGKSSLLRALSARDARDQILVENRYFSTLATRTRRAESPKRDILVTDTVGFIEDLPPWVVEAFHSTLEEIALADVILLVADASDPLPELERKLRASLRTLWEYDSRSSARGRRAIAGSVGIARGSVARSESTRRDHPPEVDRSADGFPKDVRRGDSTHDVAGIAGGVRESAHGDGASRLASHPHGARGSGPANHPHGGGGTGPASHPHGDPRGARHAAPATLAVGEPGAAGREHDPPGAEHGPPGSEPGGISRAQGGSFEADASRGPGGLAPILVALNKVDAVSDADLEAKLAALRHAGLVGSNTVLVSAREGRGLAELYERLYALLPDYDAHALALPAGSAGESFLAWIYENADVLDVTRGRETHVRFEVNAMLRSEVEARVAACGATRLELPPIVPRDDARVPSEASHGARSDESQGARRDESHGARSDALAEPRGEGPGDRGTADGSQHR